jgi:hypothetical protein
VISLNVAVQSRYDFTPLLDDKRVRALCVNGSHENRHTDDERWDCRTHKHRWTEVCNDRFAYTPTDITATDIEGQLRQFCTECGVDCAATLAPLPPAQQGLYDDL